MCGITGSTRPDRLPQGLLDRMADALAHRGPDSRGVYTDDLVALGHRRLSILDVSDRGAQPMASDDGQVVVAYNGECYNHLELRRLLRDVRWRSDSDTETLLRLYEREGPGFIRRVNGMFALAIHDCRRRQLLLFRDRLGEKPLHYAWQGGALLFASELKALLLHPAVGREIDRRALADYLLYNYIPAPRTIFRDIRKLPPGCFLRLRYDSPDPVVGRYWQLDPNPDRPPREMDEALEEFTPLFDEGVRLRLLSDVPVGCFLSGGIDSSAVAESAARALAQPLKTFTISFSRAEYDEGPQAARVAERIGAEHHAFRVTPRDFLQVVPTLPQFLDEPFADASIIPTAVLCRETRRHVTVALSGDGGDECFLGYDRYRWAEKVDRVAGLLPDAIRRAGAGLISAVPNYRARMIGRGLGYPSRERLYEWVFAGWNRQWAARLMRLPLSAVSPRLPRTGGTLPEQGSYADLQHYLPDDILVKVDRAAMAVSLEPRPPLLDHRLVEWAWRLPESLKYRQGGGKLVLRRHLFSRLPQALFAGHKRGFAVPLRHWFRGPLEPMLRQHLAPSELRAHGLLDPRFVQQMIQLHASGRYNFERQLWALLMFQLWWARYGQP